MVHFLLLLLLLLELFEFALKTSRILFEFIKCFLVFSIFFFLFFLFCIVVPSQCIHIKSLTMFLQCAWPWIPNSFRMVHRVEMMPIMFAQQLHNDCLFNVNALGCPHRTNDNWTIARDFYINTYRRRTVCSGNSKGESNSIFNT